MRLTLVVLIALSALASADPSRCPVGCDCSKVNQATCTTLEIEPFPTNEISTLELKDVAKPIELTGELFETLRLTNLRRLIIRGSNVKRMDPSAFNATQIDQLVIRQSLIRKVERKQFRDSKHIRQIDFGYSKIEHFEGIESPIVDEIVLTGCSLKAIPRGALNNLDALTYISLADNALTSVNISDIAGDQIILSNNNISKITIDFGDKIPLSLKLDNNPLQAIEISEYTDIEELHLKGCQLTNLDFFKFFPELTHLDVSYNQLHEIPEKTFSGLPNYLVQTLNLEGNQLRSIPESLGKLKSLTTLILDGNDLGTLPVFSMNSALDLFSCNNCNLLQLDERTFENMRMTKQMFLANNKLSTLPEHIFKPIVSLRTVNLANNSLTTLPKNLFAANTDLKSVTLNGNPLGAIDAGLFRNAKMITFISANNCKLTKLWALQTNVTLPSVQELWASNNSISTVSKRELKVTPKLQKFSLRNNKLECTEVTSNMFDWLDAHNVLFDHSSECTLKDYNDYADNYNELDYDNDKIDQDSDAEDDNSIDLSDEEDDKDDDLDDDDADDDASREQFMRDAAIVQGIEFQNIDRQRSSKEMLLFLLPTLVFVLTALIVLLLSVSVILCILQKRNGRHTNAPQIKIMPWVTGNKVKKHSGSIYRPLSEERIPA